MSLAPRRPASKRLRSRFMAIDLLALTLRAFAIGATGLVIACRLVDLAVVQRPPATSSRAPVV